MNKTEENLYDNLLPAMDEIKKYILSNDDWIFYFVSDISCNNDNKQLFDIVSEYPEDWESYISLDFVSFSGPSIKVVINVDYADNISQFTRYIYLLNFEDTVNRNKKLYKGKLNEIMIQNLEEEISYHKNMITEKENELKKLKLNIK